MSAARRGLAIAIGFALSAALAGAVSFGSASTRYFAPLAHATDLALTTAVGIGVGAAVAATFALGDRAVAARGPSARAFVRAALLTGLHAPIVVTSLGDFCDRRAHALAAYPLGGALRVVFVALALASPLVVTAAARALVAPRGAVSRRARRVRFGVLLVGFAAVVTALLNARWSREDHFEVHGAVVWLVALWLAEPVAAWLEGRPRSSRRARGAVAILVVAIVGVAAVPPSNRVRLLVFRAPTALGASVFAAVAWTTPPLPPSLVGADAADAPQAPRSVALVGADPIVLLLTIDSMRADALLDASNAAHLPHLSALAREGVLFTNARASSNETVRSLASVFASRLPSQLAWSRGGDGATYGDWPSDSSPRLASTLEAAGVSTSSIVSTGVLAADRGVAPGFGTEIVLARGRARALAPVVMAALLDRLDGIGDGAHLVFAHFADAHFPYAAPTRERAPRERWLAALEAVDEQVGRLRDALSTSPLASRVVLVVMGDHGEALGERGFTGRARTLHEEALRVPVVFVAPRAAPRADGAPIGLIDVAPTILELFGVVVPPSFEGRSLAPLIAGDAIELDRVLVAEGAHQRAFLRGSLKAIVDDRRKTLELFDLSIDPTEQSRFGVTTPASDR